MLELLKIKNSNPCKGATPDIASTPRRFDHVHVDLVGPLPEAQGFKYLLTVIDWFTSWPEAIPIRDIEARTVARAYIQN